MTDKQSGLGPMVSIDSYILDQEIKAIKDQLPDGSLEEGFLLRFLLRVPAADQQPSKDVWTTEMYLSNQTAANLLAHWRDVLEKTGRKLDAPTNKQH